MGLVIGGVSARDLVMDGHSVSLYVGGSPPVKVWPASPASEVVQITLGTGYQARNQFRAALLDRGLAYQTVQELPFEIELVGTGVAWSMFYGCSSLTHVPALDTSSVTDMTYMFRECTSLTSVPAMNTSQVTSMNSMFWNCAALTSVSDMDTSQVTDMSFMFYNCSALTDGNVRLIGKHPQVNTTNMITDSGLTREPFYDTNGNPI